MARYRGDWYSWAYVGEISRRIDEALVGLDPTLPVGVVLRQRPNCLAAVMALWGCGRCVTLVSPLSGDQAIADDLKELELAAVIADSEEWTRPGFAQACAASVSVQLQPGLTGRVLIRGSAEESKTRHGVPEDQAVIVSTSGTTGPAKRYAIAWEDLVPGRPPRDPSSDRGVLINALPLFSIGGVLAITNTIFGGRPIALMDRLDVLEWAGLIRDYRPRRAGAPPAVLRMVLDAEIPREWFASLKSFYTASAPLSMELADEFERVYGV